MGRIVVPVHACRRPARKGFYAQVRGSPGPGRSLVVAMLGLVAALCVTPARSEAACVLNVDLNGYQHTGSSNLTYVGTAVASDAGTFWNGVTGDISGTTSTGLTCSDGITASAVTVTWGGSLTGWTTTIAPPSLAPDLLVDYYYTQPGTGPGSFAIEHLDPAKRYDLYLYSTPGSYESYAAAFTVGGVSKTADNSLGGTGSVFTEGTNYVLYTGLAPTAGGGISGYFEALADHEAGVFSGFQLVEVPEPATLSVLALGALAMLRRAARH